MLEIPLKAEANGSEPIDALRLLFWLRVLAIGSQATIVAFVHFVLGIHLPLVPLAVTIGVLTAWNAVALRPAAERAQGRPRGSRGAPARRRGRVHVGDLSHRRTDQPVRVVLSRADLARCDLVAGGLRMARRRSLRRWLLVAVAEARAATVCARQIRRRLRLARRRHVGELRRSGCADRAVRRPHGHTRAAPRS